MGAPSEPLSRLVLRGYWLIVILCGTAFAVMALAQMTGLMR